MSLRQLAQERESEALPTVDPEYCTHPRPFFNVQAVAKDVGGTVRVELRCELCEAVEADTLELAEPTLN